MSVLTCPSCGDTSSPVIEREVQGVTLAVCSCCGMFLVNAGGVVTLGTGKHAEFLPPDDLQAFRHHRGAKRSQVEQAQLLALRLRGVPAP